MHNEHPARWSGILLLVAGALLAAALLLGWLPHCMRQPPMRCVWMINACIGVSGVIAVLGLGMAAARSAAAAMGLAAGVLMNAILLMALAGPLIGPCPNPLMHCHTETQPAVLVIGAVLAVLGLIEVWRLSRRS